MPTIPRLLHRFDRQVVMALRSKADVRSFEFKSSNTLDAAFAGATSMFEARRDVGFRSPTIRQRRLGLTDQTQRGITRVHYDPQDYQGGAVPPDAHISYLRIAEVANNGVARPDGPILVVPTPNFLNSPRPHLSVSGTAPNVAALATLLPPPGSMHFVLPRHADYARFDNNTMTDIFVSFSAGQPEIRIPGNSSSLFQEATISEVLIRANGGTSAFTAYFALVNGTYA